MSPAGIVVEPLLAADWSAVRAIYAEGLASGHATFETAVPSWETWDHGRLACCRLIARRRQEIVGWAALSPVSARQVYAGVAEVSIYVAAGARRQGIGGELLHALIEAAEQNGIWSLQASLFPENVASIKLHQNHGFRIVGLRERIAQHHGQWRDTLLLERRSRIIGN